MNCIFCCVFNQEQYIDMFYLFLESIFIYGNLDNNTHILVYTSTPFMNIIKKSHLFNDEKVKFEINDTYDNIDKACKARLDLFYLSSITNYNKILYLDTDILVKNDINKVFDVCKEDILYVLEEGEINNSNDYWGKSLFGDEINNYDDKSAFTSGILLFNNCEKINELFGKINQDIINRPYNFVCCDQPYIIYNAFKYNLYNNKILKSLVVNRDNNIHSDKVIHHFPGGPGGYQHKIVDMTIFLNGIKNKHKLFIDQILSGGFTMVSKERLENLYNQCKKFNNTNYSFVECGVAKGGCLAMMKFASGKNNRIFGFDSFEGMPDITKEDLGDYNKTDPSYWVGKLNEAGITSVYNTFSNLKINTTNVKLIKGFFEDTINVDVVNQIGKIAILRLDNDWYKSTKFCIETLYNNVIEGGAIIIDDYGTFIGCKQAIDEFRINNNITEPLIQTDTDEYYWIKSPKKYIIQIGAHIGNTCNDFLFTNIKDDITYILIEPVPYLFNELCNNYKNNKNVILLNIAISDYDGHLDLYIPSLNNNFNILPSYANQLASVNEHHLKMHVPDIIVDKITCKCITINQLIKEYNITTLDSIYIDTEGHDYDILMNLDLSNVKPYNIVFENKHMDGTNSYLLDNRPKYNALLTHFYNNNYKLVHETHEDTFLTLNNNILNLIKKTYAWENSYITFLDNFEMNAFGKGSYEFIDKQNIIANFGGRVHHIIFNDDYTEFSSTRQDDLQIIIGKLQN